MRIHCLLFSLAFCFPVTSFCHDDGGDIVIDIIDYNFQIFAFSEKYDARELTIAPTEVELAERLRELLDNDDRQAVLDELEEFFNLQLSPALLHLKGQVYFSIEDYEEAEYIFQSVLSRTPQFVRAHVDLSTLYLKLHRFEDSRLHMAKAISYGESSARSFGLLGYLNTRLHNAQSAISAYQNALMLEPTNIEWQRGLLVALTKSGMTEAALALSEQMIKTQQGDASLALNRASLYLKNEDHINALASLERAFLLGDDNPVNYLAAAQLHLKVDSFDRAIELMQLLANSEALDIEVISETISGLSLNSRWDVAEKLLDVYSSRLQDVTAREQSEFHLQRAIVFSNTNRQSLAVQSFQKSIDIDPSNAKSLLEFARYHHGNNTLVEADTYFTRASAFDETNKQALLGKAQVLIDLEDYRSALKLSREVFGKYPDLTYLSDNIRALENLVRLDRTRESTVAN